ncbi:hypothetical protein, partial [Streptomyces sp. 900105245]
SFFFFFFFVFAFGGRWGVFVLPLRRAGSDDRTTASLPAGRTRLAPEGNLTNSAPRKLLR